MPKSVEYLGINLPKDTKDLPSQTFKIIVSSGYMPSSGIVVDLHFRPVIYNPGFSKCVDVKSPERYPCRRNVSFIK